MFLDVPSAFINRQVALKSIFSLLLSDRVFLTSEQIDNDDKIELNRQFRRLFAIV